MRAWDRKEGLAGLTLGPSPDRLRELGQICSQRKKEKEREKSQAP